MLLRVRQALPEGWSLKLHARGQGKTLVVSRDRPIRIVYNSPIAPSPIEQTLQITIVAGPKASPAEHDRMVEFNAALWRKFQGNEATLSLMAPLPWWERRTEAAANRPCLLPTHFDDKSSLRIDCPPLRGRYEFKLKDDADEATGVFAAITSRFKSYAAAAAQPPEPQPADAPLALVCKAQMNYLNKRLHLSIRCDIENVATQPVSVNWGKPQVRLFSNAMIVTTCGGEKQVIIQPTRKEQKTVDIALGKDCPYLDEGPYRIRLDFRLADGRHQQAWTVDPLHIDAKFDATAGQIAAVAAEFRRQGPFWKAQHKRIDLGKWEISWWSPSHWGVKFSVRGAGVSMVEVDRKTLKPREWTDVIVRPAAPPAGGRLGPDRE